MGFVDEAKFFVKGGDGGNGCVSFRREKFVPKGGPNGGDGGKGGDVFLVADRSIRSLLDFRFKVHFKGGSGAGGQGSDKHGRGGKDCIVLVPVGTVVRDVETGAVLVDLIEHDQTYLAAAGGAGGLGNARFATSTNRAPRQSTPGQPGEERWLKIELKLLADVGLIGLPNAGKSTLLSRLSAANPKIASYPFTTLEPQLGVLHLPSTGPCIIADIPGLIEGAHRGVGLGHQFLRHIERTSILLHLIDVSGENQQPYDDYTVLASELEAYKKELINRVQVVVLNKVDLIDEQRLSEVYHQFTDIDVPLVSISAEKGTGLEGLKALLGTYLEQQYIEEDHDFSGE
ncbi:MAG: GTPase ObgE [Desulfobulbus oligotrophicus]|jgi:GTP-binding protein|nr:GTPase ObgE [Desulfobulbus oligotrophicus]